MIIICVAVRMKSKRLIHKAMADLYGMPLIDRLVERVGQAMTPHETVICTTVSPMDDLIARGRQVPVIRGDELDVMDRFLMAADKFNAEHIVRVTGDNPLTDPNLIDRMIKHHLKQDADYTTCYDVPRGTRPEIIKASALKELYPKIDPDKSEYMTYQLLEMDKIAVYESGIGRRDIRLTVDTPEDLKLIQQCYKYFKGQPPTIPGLVGWHDTQRP